jgi:hypothetical protein
VEQVSEIAFLYDDTALLTPTLVTPSADARLRDLAVAFTWGVPLEEEASLPLRYDFNVDGLTYPLTTTFYTLTLPLGRTLGTCARLTR